MRRCRLWSGTCFGRRSGDHWDWQLSTCDAYLGLRRGAGGATAVGSLNDILEILGKKHFEPTPVNLGYWAHDVKAFPPLEAVAAFADSVWHLLVANSWIGRVFIVFQLLIGAFLTALLIILVDWNNRLHSLAWTSLLCIGSIVFGSFSAYWVQQLMHIGQNLNFMQFAALAFGSGGTSGGFSVSFKVAEAWADRGREVA